MGSRSTYQENKMRKNIVSLAGMVGTLILAWGLDRLYKWLNEWLESSLNHFRHPELFMWSMLGSHLIYAAAILVLAWFIISKCERNKLVSSIFLGTGLLVLFASTPLYWDLWVRLPRDQFPRVLFSMYISLPSPRRLVVQAGAFMVGIGILSLIGMVPWAVILTEIFVG
jgi:hypothetical protein